MGMDPKVVNLMKFMFLNFLLPIVVICAAIVYLNYTDYFRLIGHITAILIIGTIAWKIYRRKIVKPKHPTSYGKWAVVTGSTSGIGKDFAEHLAREGMDVLVISRSVDKLKEQVAEMEKAQKVRARYIAYDFTQPGAPREAFYRELDVVLKELDADGGVGLLVNNVGVANEIPQHLLEFTDQALDDMIQCNIVSTVSMTRAVLKYMQPKDRGAVISISSGSGNAPSAYLAVYSATKAFMTQFSRSLSVEWSHTNLHFLVVTPFYVVSNLYKRKTGTIIAPMPEKLIEGTLAQLGKPGVYQGHGYWMHGLLQFLGDLYWNGPERMKKMMQMNRARFDERQQQKSQDKAGKGESGKKK